MSRWVWWVSTLAGCAEQAPLPCAEGPRDAPVPAAATCLDVCGGDEGPSCPTTCGTGLSLDWVVTLPTGFCERLPVIAADVPGWLLVAGASRGDEAIQRWAAAIDPGGCTLWEDRDGEGEAFYRFNVIRAVAGREDVGYYAVGVDSGGQDIDRLGFAWVRRYLPTGDVAWTWREQTEAKQTASCVAVTPDGGAVVGGAGFTGIDSRGWLRTMTADGKTSDLWWLGDANDSHVADVVVNSSGRMWASIRMPDRYFTGGWFGEVVDRSFAWLQDDVNGEVTRLALANDDSLVAIETSLDQSRLYVSGWLGSGEQLWSTTSAEYNGVRLRRGVVAADGRTIVAGGLADYLGPIEPRLLVVGPNGEVLSLQALPGIEGGEASDVAIAPDGTRYVTGLDGACDVWVARLGSDGS